jgi:hypothetical protein
MYGVDNIKCANIFCMCGKLNADIKEDYPANRRDSVETPLRRLPNEKLRFGERMTALLSV